MSSSKIPDPRSTDTTTPEDVAADLLARVANGDTAAKEELFVLVYAQLRQLAGACFRGKSSNHTLQPTALVHEAFLRMMRQEGQWNGRNHFVAVAAVAMRQILTDHARKRNAGKRGGEQTIVTLDAEIAAEGPGVSGAPPGDAGMVDVLALDAALTRLAALRPRQARIVELRYFGGLTVEEVAETLNLSRQMIEKEWRHARAWLRIALESYDSAENATTENGPETSDDQ